ncbi:proteophosphoglycan ppg4 [Variovorax sp. VNK109]|jgi:hypothetical protein|uniref:proteophosphoglycan ppg4 n=1 Tax=Variovorax sp. VNK109 TaxID=3400919 RepID=UPI003C048FFA
MMKTKLSQGLIAGAVAIAFAGGGLAIAQGNPPSTAPANPATAAGQQSPQNTPMGTTGTPTNEGTMQQRSDTMTSPAASPDINNAPVERPAQADRN